jgi:hypothetical protein
MRGNGSPGVPNSVTSPSLFVNRFGARKNVKAG